MEEFGEFPRTSPPSRVKSSRGEADEEPRFTLRSVDGSVRVVPFDDHLDQLDPPERTQEAPTRRRPGLSPAPAVRSGTSGIPTSTGSFQLASASDGITCTRWGEPGEGQEHGFGVVLVVGAGLGVKVHTRAIRHHFFLLFSSSRRLSRPYCISPRTSCPCSPSCPCIQYHLAIIVDFPTHCVISNLRLGVCVC